MKDKIDIADFLKSDIRAGTVIKAEFFEAAIKPAFKLEIDFGKELGIMRSSAQITGLYDPSILIGKQVLAVVNLKRKQIANFISECLVLGVKTNEKDVVLIAPERPVENGQKVS